MLPADNDVTEASYNNLSFLRLGLNECGVKGDGVGGGGGEKMRESEAHTPSIAFRHLASKEGCRKPVLGV